MSDIFGKRNDYTNCYIEKINNFYDSLFNYSISSNAQCLYMFLLNTFYRLPEKTIYRDYVILPKTIISGYTRLNSKQLKNARKELIHYGYIAYEDRGKVEKYTLLFLIDSK